MLKILGKNTSINVRKVLWTCEEAGIDYLQEDYGSGFASTETAEFKALNPNALVPVMIDDDFVLWESNSICRYVARKAQRDDLLPGEPQAAAGVEHWMDWQATEFNNAWRYVFPALARKNPAYNDETAIAQGIIAWNRCIDIVEQQLRSTRAWMAGETFTLADIVTGLSVNRWKMTPFDHPAVPAIDAWFSRLNNRPAFLRHGNNGMV
ncbi:glutathione S-transferase [Cronobacter turicensis]|uniref:glutathione S-transferase family protein n=1 Tax=Cronobacter turicensis TaxID=413502 RepID=UPI001E16C033|nr:glutathione S-transferase [Cronobacter turicensis]EGT4491679.1 glutathione S-transferase [Cronobacter turicensis]EKM0436156.1 glutathione S-transferase [Cronobacter turicensis]ELY4322575.1 glutathione S-transferase [Cronobacter turicensis]ELY5943111.1 glutathione S-transferase [Cronobacter turicensis]ELY5963664.1 glutathione S-transferase [Cronobacter turicensis]